MYTGALGNSAKSSSRTDKPSWRVSKGSVISEEVRELILGHEKESSEVEVTVAEPGSA